MPLLAVLLLTVGAAAFVAAASWDTSPVQEFIVQAIIVCGAVAVLLATLSALKSSATLGVYRIEGDLVWLKDLPANFLAHIPELSDEELLAWRQGGGSGEALH